MASRLQQLEEQLRDIEARWRRDQAAPGVPPNDVLVPGPLSPAAQEEPVLPGATTIHKPLHDVTAQVSRIQESAREKSMLALKQELLPRMPLKDPPWQAASFDTPRATDAAREPDQRPQLVVVQAPMRAPEAWLPAKVTHSGGLIEVSAWEAQKAAALLALESDKRRLQADVDKLLASQQQVELQQQRMQEAHRREQQLAHEAHQRGQQQLAQRHEMQLQRLVSEHREQLLQLNLDNQKAVLDAAGKAGEKLQQLQRSAWQLVWRQRCARLTACVFFVWQRAAMQTRKLLWAEAVRNRRTLDTCFAAWSMVAASLKSSRDAEAAAANQEEQRFQSLGLRCSQFRVRHLFQAWRLRAIQLAAKRRRGAKAAQHWRNVIGQALLLVLAEEAKTATWYQQLADARVHRVRLRCVFKAWMQLHRLQHLHQRHLALRALQHWRVHTSTAIRTRCRVAALQDAWRCRYAVALLRAWQQQATCRILLKNHEAVVARKHRLLILTGCMCALWTARHHAHATQLIVSKRTRRCLLAWHAAQCRRARNGRVVTAYQASRLAQTLRLAFQQWLLLSAAGARRAQTEAMTAVKGEVSNLQLELQCSRAQQVVVADRMAALQLENCRLSVEARQNLVLHASEGFMSQELRWRSLPADPDLQPPPRQRCRHLALLLPGLQGVVDGGHVVDHSDAPCLSSTLVVFGGVGGSAWYSDVQLLVINQSVLGNVEVAWQVPQVDTRHPDLPALSCTRDFAGCACGAQQFLIHGGFDGTSELACMHIFDLHRLDGMASTATRASPTPAFSISWWRVEPRNTAPSPRSHHSASYDRLGRTVLAFGGYSSSKGLLSELWAFSFDHMEWWQPETLGDQPPARRNHVAAVVNNKLLVHGGFNGTECLNDLWQLDLSSWQWSRMESKGLPPSARRGHAADIVGGRYFVVHGGYNGAKLLSDAAMFDTANCTWSSVEALGGPDDAPAPRSLHTLTAVGHACVLLGGSGSLGPLNEVHLLENPAVTAGLVQQHKLLSARRELVEAQERVAQLQAQLGIMVLERDRAQQQQQLVEARAAELTNKHNIAVRAVTELQEALEQVEGGGAADLAARQELELQLAAAQRRLQRARQGGHQVAHEAEAMHVQLCEARAHAAELEAALQQALSAAQAAQDSLAQLSGERQSLQSQLAAASSEVEVTQRMAAALEQEHHMAAERQRLRAERELSSMQDKMQADAARVMALEQQLAAVQARQAAKPAVDAAQPDQETELTVASPKSQALQGAELARLQARALAADTEVELLRKEFSSLTQELALAKHEAARERAAQQAASRTAADAVEDKHRMEFRYQRSIEQLEAQVQALQRAQWAKDLDTTQHLVKGVAASPAVAALHHMLWQGSTPPGARPATAAASGAARAGPGVREEQHTCFLPEPMEGAGSGPVSTPSRQLAGTQGMDATPTASTHLRIPPDALDPAMPLTMSPGLPHVAELLRLRAALLMGTDASTASP